MKNLKQKSEKTLLSLTAASTISNLCDQKVKDIESKMSYNNCSKYLKINDSELLEQEARPINKESFIENVKLICKYRDLQSFLMENIKQKNNLLKEIEQRKFVSPVKEPSPLVLEQFNKIPYVAEGWGKTQLSENDYNDWIEANAYASTIGKIIHDKGILDKLRNELNTLTGTEVVRKGNTEYLMRIEKHHSIEELSDLHEDLAKSHKQYNSRQNYILAKAKKLENDENDRINKLNFEGLNDVNKRNEIAKMEYQKQLSEYHHLVSLEENDFQTKKLKDKEEVANLKIEIPIKFEELVKQLS